ncbi:hypothetical protein Tco_1098733, partial [Tanacetum coccineum]
CRTDQYRRCEAMTFTEYGKAQKTAASKVDQICKGVEIGQNLAADFSVESGELVPMFVPGPFAIAHHLISSWAHQHKSTGGGHKGGFSTDSTVIF